MSLRLGGKTPGFLAALGHHRAVSLQAIPCSSLATRPCPFWAVRTSPGPEIFKLSFDSRMLPSNSLRSEVHLEKGSEHSWWRWGGVCWWRPGVLLAQAITLLWPLRLSRDLGPVPVAGQSLWPLLVTVDFQ